MEGAGDREPWDFEAMGEGGDLAGGLWEGSEGRAHLEFELADRLHSLHVQEEFRDADDLDALHSPVL